MVEFDANKLIAFRFEFDGDGVVLVMAEDKEVANQMAVRAIIACGKDDFDDAYIQELLSTLRLCWQQPFNTLDVENRTLLLRGSML